MKTTLRRLAAGLLTVLLAAIALGAIAAAAIVGPV